MNKLCCLLLLIPTGLSAQYEKIDDESGHFSLGVRNTVSAFGHAAGTGFGYGGQFRIRVLQRINTDWFADYITSDIEGLARRTDGHIGWSVLAYPLNHEMKKGKFTPYILAGHCFDYTKLVINSTGESSDKWSSAVQAGLGMHYNITDRADISLTSQYMMHLGYDVHAEVHETEAGPSVHLHKEKVSGIEGHLLFNLSLNVRLADMWDQRRKKA
jgi:opacity protein-like surface antigen